MAFLLLVSSLVLTHVACAPNVGGASMIRRSRDVKRLRGGFFHDCSLTMGPGLGGGQGTEMGVIVTVGVRLRGPLIDTNSLSTSKPRS
jgi:hypothetical protein